MSIDAIPGGDIDTTRSVAVGSKFSVSVILDTYTGAPYQSYQVTLEYDDVELDGNTGLPGNWGDAPVADVTGGNLAVFPNGALCDPSPTENSVTFENDEDQAQIGMTCADVATNGRTSHTGALVEIVLTCEEEGTATLSLGDINNTFVLDDIANPQLDHAHDAAVTCGGTPVATNTPAPVTPTPPAGTATPGGAQPTSAAPTGGGTPATGVSGPDTGTGPLDPRAFAWVPMLAAAVLVVAGAALGGAGLAGRRRAQR